MPQPISREDVAHLASLARIDLSPDELDRLGAELPTIVDYVAQITGVAGADVVAMSHPQPIVNVLREDVVVPGLSAEAALAGAPESDEQRFLVPRILGED